MKEGSRSGNVPGSVERSRGPFGCLIVKKKGDGVTNGVSIGKQKPLQSKEKKRPRLILSESEPDEDSIVSLPTNVISRDRDASVVVRNGARQIEIDRKRKSEPVIYREDNRIDRNKFLEAGRDIKRTRIDDIGYPKDGKFGKVLLRDGVEERRTEIGRNGVLISKTRVPIGKGREFETDSSRSIQLGNRDHSEFKRSSNLSVDPERESVHMDGQRFERKKHGNFRPGSVREKLGIHHGKPIRVQGKNGVLKVMPSNKNNMGQSEKFFTPKKDEENRKGPRSTDYSNGKTPLSPALYSENKLHEKSHSLVVTEKKQVNSIKKLSTKHNAVYDQRTQVSEVSLCRESKDVVTCSSKKEVSSKKQKTLTSEPCVSTSRKEREVKRGSGTEKQVLREQIRQMLVNAGWTIDLRPRRNRDYQDSVYINPAGTEYWSITKAYYAFQKHFEDDDRDQKKSEDFSTFTLIPEDVLSKLTRKTRKKVEREMKMQKKTDRGSKNVKGTAERKLKNKHVKVKTDSSMSEEDTNSYVMQDGKSLKVRPKGNNVVGQNTDDPSKSKKSTPSKVGWGNEENKKQSGRALLVRSSSKGLNMDGDDFVPYTGKRTVLSWLIDMKTVRLSEKVQYMNKKRTRAMLEGWITRDGIHCRCCSKILTISKFELHAGSKLHNPFQNIIVENGVSLYQCQLDAWNMQDKSVRLGFQSIDVDGDDPNDDTCAICGDGGDLICCDGCPSTFHQSCLDIQMLPSGDWLCPNCSCKFCGGIVDSTGQEEDTPLCSCTLCEEKYHQLCRERADPTSIDSDSLSISFCGKACEELFQQLQKLLGVKHELEAGFSWTLIQRSNLDSDSSSRRQCLKAECNAKIAVALTVMDECFLPVIDQRSGVTLIHNVAFNIGSNFNRLNYSGFYTAILERGDEIISAASIRIHGTKLAEMPFIGTRHIYRRQGMCRRLLDAIESALCSLSVEKLVIPAISELMYTWTTVFGFKPLEEAHRQEVKTLNMLVFPSTDLLQKPLLKNKLNKVDVTESSVVKAVEPNGNNHIMPEMSENTDISSVEPDICARDKGAVCDREMNDGVCFIENGSRSPGGSTCDTFDTINNPSDSSHGTIPDGPSDYSAPETKFLSPGGVNRDNKLDVGTNPILNSSGEPKFQNFTEDDPHEVNVEAASVKLILHSLDETSVERTTGNNTDYLITVSSNGFQPTDTKSNSDLSEQNVRKVESKDDFFSVEPSSCAPDKGAVYNHEMKCVVASIGTGPQDPAGSRYDTPDMINKPLDAALGSIPDGPSEESAPDTKFLLHHIVDHDIEFDVETKPVFSSSVELKLRNTTEDDAHQMKAGAAGVELDLHPLDKNSLQRTSSTNIDCPNDFFGNCRTGGNHVQGNFDLNEPNVHKVECKSEMVSFELGICAGEKSIVYDRKVHNGVASIETGAIGLNGSSYDTSEMTGNPSDVSFRHIPDARSNVSALELKCLLPCMNHDTKLDVETNSCTELKLQNCTEDNALEVNVEIASREHTTTYSNFLKAISGNSFERTSGDPAERSSGVNENNIQNLGCTSIEVCHDISNAIYLDSNLLSTPESTKQDISEVKTEVSAVASDLYPSGEGRGYNHLQVATLGSAVRGTCKLENGVSPNKLKPQDLREDLMGCTSEVTGLLLDKVQLPKPQGTCTCKWGVELEVGFACCKDQTLSCSSKGAPRQQTPH